MSIQSLVKRTQWLCFFDVPFGSKYVCLNRDGQAVVFYNPPVIDEEAGYWKDSVTGEAGELATLYNWHAKIYRTEDLNDIRMEEVSSMRKLESIKRSLNGPMKNRTSRARQEWEHTDKGTKPVKRRKE